MRERERRKKRRKVYNKVYWFVPKRIEKVKIFVIMYFSN